MMIKSKEIVIKTNKRRELINITEYVEKFVEESKIKEGLVHIFVPHATAALIINEDEPLIKKDYLDLFERLVPESGTYNHNKIDNNADSHLLSVLLKPFLILPIKDGKLYRGTWQEIFLVELDGPRNRKILITVIGR